MTTTSKSYSVKSLIWSINKLVQESAQYICCSEKVSESDLLLVKSKLCVGDSKAFAFHKHSLCPTFDKFNVLCRAGGRLV